jgi:hypothetical protein
MEAGDLLLAALQNLTPAALVVIVLAFVWYKAWPEFTENERPWQRAIREHELAIQEQTVQVNAALSSALGTLASVTSDHAQATRVLAQALEQPSPSDMGEVVRLRKMLGEVLTVAEASSDENAPVSALWVQQAWEYACELGVESE